MGEVTAKEAD